MSQTKAYEVVVIAPVYDDAMAAAQLLPHLQDAFTGSDVHLRVIFVDDGSPVPLIEQLQAPGGMQVNVLRLKRNVGHQRAIALGTAYVEEHVSCDAALVMDADGEDRPEDAARLVARCRETMHAEIVFAERARRSESILFQVFYRLFQLLHWMITGMRVRVGNFSVVPVARLAALVTLPSLWNHYAAAIFQSRLPRLLVPSVRGTRYSGRSKMNFVALVMHGLQAISVFNEIVTVRLLLTACFLACGCGMIFFGTLAWPFLTGVSAPGLAAFLAGALLFVAVALAVGSFSLTLGFLANRNSLNFIPSRDYSLFVEGLTEARPTESVVTGVFPPLDDGPSCAAQSLP